MLELNLCHSRGSTMPAIKAGQGSPTLHTMCGEGASGASQMVLPTPQGAFVSANIALHPIRMYLGKEQTRHQGQLPGNRVTQCCWYLNVVDTATKAAAAAWKGKPSLSSHSHVLPLPQLPWPSLQWLIHPHPTTPTFT